MKRLLSIILAMALACMPLVAVADEEVNYFTSESMLTIGTASYDVSAEYDYTVYAFEPGEIGKYTISVDNGLVGIVSYLTMWVQNTPSTDNVNATSVDWDCTDENQGIYIAVNADAESVNITVEKEQIVIKQIEWTVYENTHTPAAFTFDFTEDDIEYVDIENNTVDDAVLGEDGYYHLNAVDGPVLYADLDDDYYLTGGIAGVIGTTALKHVIEPEVSGVDYTAACAEYVACADGNTMLYPLTVDLIEIYKNSGIDKGWYGEGGYVSGNEDGWMFACCFVEDNNTIVDGPINPDVPDKGENGEGDGETNGSTKDEVDPDIKDEPTSLGDINGNNKIDMTDYILLKRAYFGTFKFNDAQNVAGDINKNQKIDMTDYILLKRVYFGTYTIK